MYLFPLVFVGCLGYYSILPHSENMQEDLMQLVVYSTVIKINKKSQKTCFRFLHHITYHNFGMALEGCNPEMAAKEFINKLQLNNLTQ